ncbi:MAG: ester cyclase [Polyangiales bacterium]
MNEPSIQENKRIAIELSLAIARGDWSAVDALLAPDFAYVGDGRPLSRAQYIAFMRDVLCVAMTEMDMKFTRTVAEGELVALEYANEMTHSGPFVGIAPSQRRVTATGHLIRQVRDGRVVAEWQTTNAGALIAQLQGASR